MDRKEPIRKAAERLLAGEGMELVDVELRREPAGLILRLYIDKPGGVTLADCKEVSDQMGSLIEVEDLIPHRYTLEVSSPGLDRVLRKDADFERFAGRRVRITMQRPVEGRRRFQGLLQGVNEGQVVLTTDDSARLELPLEEVAEARLEVELDGFNQKPGRPGPSRGRATHAASPAHDGDPAGNRRNNSR